jgi:hypothetical protein
MNVIIAAIGIYITVMGLSSDNFILTGAGFFLSTLFLTKAIKKKSTALTSGP